MPKWVFRYLVPFCWVLHNFSAGFIPNYCIPGHVTEPATEPWWDILIESAVGCFFFFWGMFLTVFLFAIATTKRACVKINECSFLNQNKKHLRLWDAQWMHISRPAWKYKLYLCLMLWRWIYKNLQHCLQGKQDMTPYDAMPASASGGLLYDLHVQPLSRRTFEDKGTASWNWIPRCFQLRFWAFWKMTRNMSM